MKNSGDGAQDLREAAGGTGLPSAVSLIKGARLFGREKGVAVACDVIEMQSRAAQLNGSKYCPFVY